VEKSGQNAYAESGVLGSTVRETHPELENKSVAVDYHGTININGKVNEEMKQKMIEWRNTGTKIVIHTAGITHSPGSLNGINTWLQENQIPYDEIWQRTGKPDADLYVDDKSIRPNEIDTSEV